MQAKKNPVREAVKSGKNAFGLYIGVPSPMMVEFAGYAGFDFVRIDISHNGFDLPTIVNMIRAAELCGVAPMVRVDNDPFMINSVLEAGAVGVYVPDVSTAEKAKAVVDVVRFAPLGERGIFGASRAAGYGGISGADYRKFSNEEVMLGVQIESRQAAENIAAILGVEGIDMVGSGRGDLANSLGVTGQKDHPSVLALEAKIFDTARGRGKCISVNLDPTAKDFAEEVAAWKKKAGIITLGHDINIIRKNFEKAIQCARESQIQASGQQA